VHPTAIPGEDKLRLMSESARGGAEGRGALWVAAQIRRRSGAPKKHSGGGTILFLEEWYPKYGNLVAAGYRPRARFHRIVYQEKLGVDGAAGRWFFLDVDAHPARDSGPQARRDSGDLRKVFCGGRSAAKSRLKVFSGHCITPWAGFG